MAYKTGTYVKGEQARVVQTQADAVAAVFDGFKLVEEAPVEDSTPEPEPSRTAVPDTDSALETSVDPEPLPSYDFPSFDS